MSDHKIRIHDNVPGMNFQVRCSCRFKKNVIRFSRKYAERCANEHIQSVSKPLPEFDVDDD